MKKYLYSLSTLLLLIVLMISGCAKDEPAPEDPSTTTTGAPVSGFTWTPSGGADVVANEFNFIENFNNIVAIKNESSTEVDIVVDTLDAGVHTISPSIGHTLKYVVGSTTYNAKSGSLNITSKTNTRMSGNFTAALTGGSITSISGQFVNIPSK